MVSWQLLHVGCAAVLGALFLFATACGPSPSTPTSASTPAASKPVAQPNVTPASVEAVSQGQALLAQKGFQVVLAESMDNTLGNRFPAGNLTMRGKFKNRLNKF